MRRDDKTSARASSRDCTNTRTLYPAAHAAASDAPHLLEALHKHSAHTDTCACQASDPGGACLKRARKRSREANVQRRAHGARIIRGRTYTRAYSACMPRTARRAADACTKRAQTAPRWRDGAATRGARAHARGGRSPRCT